MSEHDFSVIFKISVPQSFDNISVVSCRSRAASMACGRFADSCGHQLSGHSRWGPKPRKLHKENCQFRMLNEYRMHGCVFMSFCGNVWRCRMNIYPIIQDTFSLPRSWQVRREESHRLTGLTGSLTFAQRERVHPPQAFLMHVLTFLLITFFKLPTEVIFRCAV